MTPETRASVLRVAESQLGSSDWSTYQRGVGLDGGRLGWCGIFCLWCLKMAGVGHDLRWVLRKGIRPSLPQTLVSRAEPGDLLWMYANQHYAMFTHRVGDEIHSIDGNSVGGMVCRRARPASEWAACFSISGLGDPVSPVPLPSPPVGMVSPSPELASLGIPAVERVSRSKGEHWKPLQRALAESGAYTGRIDGDPGPLTCTALVETAVKLWDAGVWPA